jgi:hypothetical protein
MIILRKVKARVPYWTGSFEGTYFCVGATAEQAETMVRERVGSSVGCLTFY